MSNGSALLYSPPEQGAPWLLVIFQSGNRAYAFEYVLEADAREALAASNSRPRATIDRENLNAAFDELRP